MSARSQSAEGPPSPNLALIGGRGCGKTSVARELAECHSRFDLQSIDAAIRSERGGKSIPEIVESEDWSGFRELEYRVLLRLVEANEASLLDCGGGIVVDLDSDGGEIFSERKVRALRSHAFVVYLHCDLAILLSRIEGDPERPALSSSESFEQIMERREPWYRRAADAVVEVDELSTPELADMILATLARGGRDGSGRT